MTIRSAAVLFCALAVLPSLVQGKSAGSDAARQADLAGIEKFLQQDIAATVSRDPGGLTDLFTDDAVQLSPGQPALVGKQAIRDRYERMRPGVKVLSYVPEDKDVTVLDGWAVVWGYTTGSYTASPGGEVKQHRGMRMMVLKKLPDGNWKCFRGMGAPSE